MFFLLFLSYFEIILSHSFSSSSFSSSFSFSSSSVSVFPTGFIFGNLHFNQKNQKNFNDLTISFNLKTIQNILIDVNSISFHNFPSSFKLYSSNFTILSHITSFDRPVYSNGKEYLYYIFNSKDENAQFGTWLIGNKIGVDRGIAFYKPQYPHYLPLQQNNYNPRGSGFGLGSNMEENQMKSSWYLLQDSKWNKYENITLQSTSSTSSSSSIQFYVVEYINNESQLSQSILLLHSPSINISTSIFCNILNLFLPDINFKLPPISSHSLFWSLDTESWEIFHEIYSIPFGSACILRSEVNSLQEEQIGHLINEEYLGKYWRLSFRLTDLGNETELMIGIDNFGLRNNYIISPQNNQQIMKLSYYKTLNNKFKLLQPGDYGWLWYDINKPDLDKPFNSFSLTPSTINMIVKCISNDNDVIIFEYFHSDRRDAMSRSILSHTTNYIIAKSTKKIITTNDNSCSNFKNNSKDELFDYEFSLDSTKLSISSFFLIGSNPVQWITDHLIVHEHILSSSVSSCFMYHAGATIPQQFIYAAEIICFLMGAKPIVMVQFSTPSDHQWKFPLVSQLIKGILIGKQLYPQYFPETIYTQINTYDTDQTLILSYRKYIPLVQLILPNNTAQALHIVPYPSESNGTTNSLNLILKKQIYHSWWNGYVLGYPEFLIDSYCESFHTTLDIEMKHSEIKKVKRDIYETFKKNKNKTLLSNSNEILPIQIKLGNDINLINEFVSKFLSNIL